LSFADVLKHLVDADRWLFERLDGGPPSEGVIIAPGDADGTDRKAAVEELGVGEEEVRRINTLGEEQVHDQSLRLG
jgi:hypothetical protein